MTKKIIRFKVKAVNIPVIYFKEHNQYVAYAPALDLSTCGKTYDQAEQRFIEITRLFFEDLIEQDTLAEVLTSCGWEVVKKNNRCEFLPPQIVNTTSIPITVNA